MFRLKQNTQKGGKALVTTGEKEGMRLGVGV